MGKEWYVARDGQTYGPFTPEQMNAGVREGQLRREDFVWCAGMPEWQLAIDVRELWLPSVERSPESSHVAGLSSKQDRPSRPTTETSLTAEGPTASASVAPKANVPPRSGFIVRHWRGELTLARAYWGVGFLLTLVVIFLAHVFGASLDKARLPPIGVGVALLGFLSFLCVMTIWQLVGIWRAAGNHMRSTGRRTWATLARVAVCIGAIRAAMDFATVIGPMLSESAKLASGRDDTPAHQLRLLRNGTEVELAGGMPFGTADALAKLLDAAPGVQVLHLNSIGGRVAEGYRIHEIVRDRGLATYTATDCVSACTIAFLGGSRRYLSNQARLGFHSTSFGGVDHKRAPDINADMRRMLAAHGAPSWFIDKALSTAADSMWYPPSKDLIAAKIVTHIVDPDQFGMSGIANWRDSDSAERSLMSIPIYASIRDHDPEGFRKVAARFADGVKLGKSTPELIRDVQAVLFADILPKYLEVAPDGAIRRYYRARLAGMEHLAKTDPALCVAYEFPEQRRGDFNVKKLVPVALFDEETAALTELVQEAIRAPQRQKASDADAKIAAAVARVAKRIPSSKEILAEPSKYFTNPRPLCAVLLALYADVLNLPPSTSGQILRSLAEPAR